MAFIDSKLPGRPLLPLNCKKSFTRKGPATATPKRAPALQARSENEQVQSVGTSCTFSRRDSALRVAAVTLSTFTLLLTKPVEARTTKLENKKKVMERLERLREKAKVSKPGSPDEEKIRRPPPQPLVEALLP